MILSVECGLGEAGFVLAPIRERARLPARFQVPMNTAIRRHPWETFLTRQSFSLVQCGSRKPSASRLAASQAHRCSPSPSAPPFPPVAAAMSPAPDAAPSLPLASFLAELLGDWIWPGTALLAPSSWCKVEAFLRTVPLALESRLKNVVLSPEYHTATRRLGRVLL